MSRPRYPLTFEHLRAISDRRDDRRGLPSSLENHNGHQRYMEDWPPNDRGHDRGRHRYRHDGRAPRYRDDDDSPHWHRHGRGRFFPSDDDWYSDSDSDCPHPRRRQHRRNQYPVPPAGRDRYSGQGSVSSTTADDGVRRHCPAPPRSRDRRSGQGSPSTGTSTDRLRRQHPAPPASARHSGQGDPDTANAANSNHPAPSIENRSIAQNDAPPPYRDRSHRRNFRYPAPHLHNNNAQTIQINNHLPYYANPPLPPLKPHHVEYSEYVSIASVRRSGSKPRLHWIRPVDGKRRGMLGRLKDGLFGEGPDVYIVRGNSRNLHYDRPSKPDWARWPVYDYHDPPGGALVVHPENMVPWADRRGKTYNPFTRKYEPFDWYTPPPRYIRDPYGVPIAEHPRRRREAWWP